MTTQAEALPADRFDFRIGSPLLSVRELRTHLLKPASFSLSAGECIAIRGPSGGGKTLLLRAIADLDPSEGIVYLEGHDRTTMSGPEWRRLVGYLPAEPGWWADTVGEHFTDWPAAACIAKDLGFPDDEGLADCAVIDRRAAAARACPRAHGEAKGAAARRTDRGARSGFCEGSRVVGRRANKRGSGRAVGHPRCRAGQACRGAPACR